MRPTDNPFEGISTEAQADVYDWPPQALRFVERDVDTLHIIGDCGMGKTTLLRQIHHRIAAEGENVSYACVPLDGILNDADLQADVVLLDETDRLDAQTLCEALSMLWEGGRKAVLAGHQDQRKAIRKAGFSPVFLKLRPLRSAERLARILDERISLALDRRDHPYKLTPTAARALLARSRGNIERCLQIGYEVFEDIETARAIEATDIAVAAALLDDAIRPVEE